MSELDIAWEEVTKALTLVPSSSMPLVNRSMEFCEDLSYLKKSLEILHDYDMDKVIREWFFNTVQQHLSSEVSPKFWSYFVQPVKKSDVFGTVRDCFDYLYSQLSIYLPCARRLEEIEQLVMMIHSVTEPLDSPLEHLKLIFKGTVFYSGTKHFCDAILEFLGQAFCAFDAKYFSLGLDDSMDDLCETLMCRGCKVDQEGCQCSEVFDIFSHLADQLYELGMLERVFGEPVMLLVHRRIEQRVDKCRDNFDIQNLETLEKWLDTRVGEWLDELFKNALSSVLVKNGAPVLPLSLFPTHRDRLHYYMCETYGRVRIQQLFNIIIEYPESEPALLDLADCLQNVFDLRAVLVRELKQALETRLLHPGVNTSDILTAYISAIRALRVLDRSGVLLDLVCEPVRKYLRSRDDTVRCIVSNLTEDGNSELSDELTKGQPLVLDESCSNDDCIGSDWESWQPDPVDAEPFKSTRSRSSDIISMLVNIYGSKELFIDEYRSLLADRILSQFNYDTEREIRYLELLKLRFGESHLHECEVMLKDVADSRRINSHIQECIHVEEQKTGKPNPEIPINAMILSAQFWPARLREEKVELPGCLKDSLTGFTKAYELLKGNRTLCWKPHLGLVNLEIELKNKTLNYCVSPVHATIIWHYQQQSRWTVDELSTVMQMPSHALQRKMAFWQSQGLLREETTDTFVLVEEHKGHVQEVMSVEEDETESVLTSPQDQKEEEQQTIWSYIVGMLTNLDSLPIDRIHSMLKMFAMQGPGSQYTLTELKVLLDRKVKEQKLAYANGMYRLVKQ